LRTAQNEHSRVLDGLNSHPNS